ncbi:response regulator transcription factor [Halobacillus sp. ACCC02827]|uniref:response regulator transcription factor n=1 Tax=unclassified Halobacillus TaxID=2636472 RepID=UPI0009EF090D|nr:MULTISPECIES: response regulator transcription factor [unclassified Halobacillus]WJE15014.1 response regulator transcription factor [Halobacillus sp. ACCC02827]
MISILIVDDDPHILDLVKLTVEQAGFLARTAEDGKAALLMLEKESFDLVIVDVMMPGLDGFSLTKEIRKFYDLPVILLTAKGELYDKEQGYDAGTDDYIVKPFEPRELVFRIRAVLRRYDKPADLVVRAGDIIIDRKNYEVAIGRQHLLLPLKEFELLSLLASRPNRVLQRDMLIEQIWGLDFEGDERTLNVHIKRIRERLAGAESSVKITTVRGIGYKLEASLL